MINIDIFREYDIRGIADRDLTPEVIKSLGQAFAAYLKEKDISSITVGFDARISSPRLCENIVQGLTDGGLDVTIIGLCPTPALYFSLYHLKPGAGVMITGSHNPSEFNGFKLCVNKDTIYGEEIQKLKDIMMESTAGSILKSDPSVSGSVLRLPILPDYINQLKNLFKTTEERPLKIVLDAGNGTAGLAAPDVVRAMGCDVIELYSEPDGSFPNHHPDPTIPKNLAALIKTVITQKADAGIAFDGDSDRMGVVDEKGNILWGDQLMIIFSRDILNERPGSTFVSEVKCSQVMYNDIRSHGGTAVMWKAGHSLIKAKMKEVHAVMAGEMSGHLFFADRYFGYDDAIYAACRLVEILKKLKAKKGSTASLSMLIADLPKTYNTPEIRLDCPEIIKFRVVEKVKEIYSKGTGLLQKPQEVITIDGVRAIFKNGWGLIRASNTQPILVMRFEASDPVSLESIQAMMQQTVTSIISQLTEISSELQQVVKTPPA
jgi:phosphomannomutase / phosphoglucomutase